MAWTMLLPVALSPVTLSCFVAWCLAGPPSGPVGAAEPEALEAEAAAVRALQPVASNIQKNRDGTVRFVRLSRPTVSDDHVRHLRAFTQLDYLAVVTPTVTDAGLAPIGSLDNLDTLVLSGSGFTDGSAAVLSRLDRLERLYLDGTGLTDAGLYPLSALKSLKTLSLAGTAVSDDGLAALTNLSRLEELLLSGTRVTDAGLADVARLPNLRVLRLDDTSVTGSGLRHLRELEQLETLDLSGTKVTAADLATMRPSRRLKYVLLFDTAVRGQIPDLIRERFPGVTFATVPAPDDAQSAWQRVLAGEPLRGVRRKPATATTPTPATAGKPILAAADRRFGAGRSDGFNRAAQTVPDLQRHVIPLLGRLGCNGRTCHGSFQGQGGFRLSMFGYDFAADHEALTGGESPRISTTSPDESLVLYKPTHGDEHGGGERFRPDGWEYRLIREWIAAGAPPVPNRAAKLDRLEVSPAEIVFGSAGGERQLRVLAHWSDGTCEDVTPLTRFQSNDESVAEVTADGFVRSRGTGDTHAVAFYDNAVVAVPVIRPLSDRSGGRFPPVPTPTRVDELVVAKLRKTGLVPSRLCSDEEFLRRVSLDLAGTLPTADEVRRFLADSSPDKRARKIDALLETPAYVEWWTTRLGDLTGANAQFLGTTDMNRPAAEQWRAWLRRRVADNVGWDEIAAGILLATSRRPGQPYDEYAAEQSAFLRRENPEDFTALDRSLHYYWFRSNNQLPSDRALSFGYVFLGVRLQCAQCHKHPFDEWSQQDFEQFARFFTRIEAGVSPMARAAQASLKTKLGVPTKLDTAALRRQMYLRVSAEGHPSPWNEVWIEPPGDAPETVRLLGGDAFDLGEFDDPREPLVAWLLADDNPYFARAMVNRVWAHYFGVGIVDPPDNLNLANPPSNGPLLDWLAREFVAHRYDMKWLHRTITGSRTYQLSWRANDTNRRDERHFSRSLIRRLPAEVAIDAILQATAADPGGNAAGGPRGGRLTDRKIAQQPKSIQARGIDYSLLVFGKPLRTTNCDCERQMQPTLIQSLYVRNDQELLGWLERPDGWLAQVGRRWGLALSPEAQPGAAVTTGGQATAAGGEVATRAELTGVVESAYLRTLSRLPTAKEMRRARGHVAGAVSPLEGLRDLMWALLNTQEFLTNH